MTIFQIVLERAYQYFWGAKPFLHDFHLRYILENVFTICCQ